MCQPIPRRVLLLEYPRAQVDAGGQPTWVDARALPDLAVGEYVLVYAGLALDRVPTVEAEAMLAFYAGLDALLGETAP